MNRLALAALAALSLSACGGGGGGSAPSALPVVTQAVVPAAAPFAVIGDSISGGYNAGNGWVNDISQAWPAFASQMTGRPVDNPATGGSSVPGMITSQVPQIPLNTTTVVYAGGTNDIAHGYDSGQTQDQVLALIDQMVAAIHARVPKAQIVFLNVRIFYWPENPNTTAWTQAWDAHEASLGYPVVDIENQHPEANLPGPNAWYPDGMHPSPQQVQVIAGLVAAALKP